MDEPEEVGRDFLYETTFSLGQWGEGLRNDVGNSDEVPMVVTLAKSERYLEELTSEEEEGVLLKEEDGVENVAAVDGFGDDEYISLGLGNEVDAVPAPAVREQVEVKEELAKPAVIPKKSVPPPWARAEKRRKRIHSPFLQLHQDIVDFTDFVTPTEEEKASRAAAVQRVTSVVQSIWPIAKVELFGSFATGLYLPTSDCDMVVLHSGVQAPVEGLRALAKGLTRKSLAKNLQVISKARVPIVKFVESESNIAFDISFDVANGPEAAAFIREAIESWPPLKPLCMVLKIFLQQRELNEVYTGGIGSYALLTMLIAHLQLHPSWREPQRNRIPRLETNLGILLVDFFELYGRSLNMRDVGVSCRNGGTFYSKRAEGKTDPQRGFLLSVEDPQDRKNDICKSSFNISKVRSAFMHAFRLLTTDNPEGAASDCDGMLARIIRVDGILLQRSVAYQRSSALAAGTSGTDTTGEGSAEEDDEREDGEWEDEKEEKNEKEEKQEGGESKDGRSGARPPHLGRHYRPEQTEGSKGKSKEAFSLRRKKRLGEGKGSGMKRRKAV